MLQLINYDLQEPVKNYPALQEGIEEIGGGIHVLKGPWIVDSGRAPEDVLKAVAGRLDRNDKLLVFPVQMGEIAPGSDLDPAAIERHDGDKVFAVTYAFRNPSAAKRRNALIEALQRLGDTCHPLDALWLVKTDQSAHQVRLELEKAVPLAQRDELMVTEVNTSVKGDEEGLKPADHDWLVKAGVL